jgi:hypothetical protein
LDDQKAYLTYHVVRPTCDETDPAELVADNGFDAFASGAATVIDLGGHTSLRIRVCDDDIEELTGDWEALGQDFRAAAEELARELVRHWHVRGQEVLFDADDYAPDR